MDQQRRSGKRDSSQPYKKGGAGYKGRIGGGRGRGGPRGPRMYSDSTAAEDLAEYVLTVLARDPNAVQITRETFGGGRATLNVSCDPASTGRLIGKDGRTITALRQLIRAVAGRYGKRINIELDATQRD